MRIQNLSAVEAASPLHYDIAIIGGGPAGISIARAFFGARASVLILESGMLEHNSDYEELNALEVGDDVWRDEQIAYRSRFHSTLTKHWSHQQQPYGVRTRLLGGGTSVWAGKSAAFDPIDYEARPWAPNTGWPLDAAAIAPYVEQAGAALNLGPQVYDARAWELIGCTPPERLKHFNSFFWQFARSRIDSLDAMRFGPEFLREKAENVSVLYNATATALHLTQSGKAIDGVSVESLEGKRAKISAKIVVLACGGVETARLMLASRDVHTKGVGNGADLVGRYLIDHPQARIGSFNGAVVAKMDKEFGFYSVNAAGRSYPYQHGLTVAPEVQRERGLLNGAIYMMGERAHDDPLEAIKRLLKSQSASPLKDVWAGATGAGMLAKAATLRALQHRATPRAVRSALLGAARILNPRFDAKGFMARGLPHKLSTVHIDVMLEQAPEATNRVMLSDRVDRFGMPLARVEWRIGDATRRTLGEMCTMFCADLKSRGLDQPQLASWVKAQRWDEAVLIDSAHMMGATRMAADPQHGVVDVNCRVHGVANLYVAGGSVFPTGGHANPTLMITAVALRLADRLKAVLADERAPKLESAEVGAFAA